MLLIVHKNLVTYLFVLGTIVTFILQPQLLTAYALGMAVGSGVVNSIHTYYYTKNLLVQNYRFSYYAFVGMFSTTAFAMYRTYLVPDFGWMVASAAGVISCIQLVRILRREYRFQLQDLNHETRIPT